MCLTFRIYINSKYVYEYKNRKRERKKERDVLLSMVVTLDTFHLEISSLKVYFLLNTFFRLRTSDVSQISICPYFKTIVALSVPPFSHSATTPPSDELSVHLRPHPEQHPLPSGNLSKASQLFTMFSSSIATQIHKE